MLKCVEEDLQVQNPPHMKVCVNAAGSHASANYGSFLANYRTPRGHFSSVTNTPPLHHIQTFYCSVMPFQAIPGQKHWRVWMLENMQEYDPQALL